MCVSVCVSVFVCSVCFCVCVVCVRERYCVIPTHPSSLLRHTADRLPPAPAHCAGAVSCPGTYSKRSLSPCLSLSTRPPRSSAGIRTHMTQSGQGVVLAELGWKFRSLPHPSQPSAGSQDSRQSRRPVLSLTHIRGGSR